MFVKPTIHGLSYNALQEQGVDQENVKFDINKSIKVRCEFPNGTTAGRPVMLFVDVNGKLKSTTSLTIDGATAQGGKPGWWGICEEDVSAGEFGTVVVKGKATAKNANGSTAVAGKLVTTILATDGTLTCVAVSDAGVKSAVAVVTKATAVDAPCEIYIY
jgi:hypothetical protein